MSGHMLVSKGQKPAATRTRTPEGTSEGPHEKYHKNEYHYMHSTRSINLASPPLKKTNIQQGRSPARTCAEYQRQRCHCKNCGGCSFCNHQRKRSAYKDCGSSGLCEHQRTRIQGKDCGGSAICEHQRVRRKCVLSVSCSLPLFFR